MILTIDPGTDRDGIQDILDGLKPDDTAVFSPGTYYLDRNLYLNNSGQPDAPITVQGGGATIEGETINLTGSHWTIEGLHFRDHPGDVIKIGDEQGPPSVGIKLDSCQFVGNQGRPLVLRHMENGVIVNCLFQDTNTGEAGRGANAIDLILTDRITVQNCRFIDNWSDGIQPGGIGRSVIRHLFILNNLFEWTDPSKSGGENGLDFKSIIGPAVVRGNTFRGFRPCGIREDGYPEIGHGGGSPRGPAITCHVGAKNILIEENIIEDCTTGIIVADHSDRGYDRAGNIVVRNNRIFRAVAFAGNAVKPASPGAAILLKDLNNTNFIEDNYFVGCDQAIVQRGGNPQMANNHNLTQAEYEKISDKPITDLGEMAERVAALEENLAEAERELGRIGAIVEDLGQGHLLARLQTNEARLNDQQNRIQAIETGLKEVSEVLRDGRN